MPEDAEGSWRSLETADELVEFYDPTDVFGDLADALAEAYPSVPRSSRGEDAAEGDASGRRRATATTASAEASEDEPTA